MTYRFNAAAALPLVGAALIVIGLFVDWYEPDLNAWESFEVVDLILVALAIGAVIAALGPLGLAATEGTGSHPGPDRGGERAAGWLTALGLAALILVAAALVDPPRAAGDASRGVGAWLALAGALVLVLAGVVAARWPVPTEIRLAPREPRARPTAPEPPKPGIADAESREPPAESQKPDARAAEPEAKAPEPEPPIADVTPLEPTSEPAGTTEPEPGREEVPTDEVEPTDAEAVEAEPTDGETVELEPADAETGEAEAVEPTDELEVDEAEAYEEETETYPEVDEQAAAEPEPPRSPEIEIEEQVGETLYPEEERTFGFEGREPVTESIPSGEEARGGPIGLIQRLIRRLGGG